MNPELVELVTAEGLGSPRALFRRLNVVLRSLAAVQTGRACLSEEGARYLGIRYRRWG
jgi:hypothetical protein